MRQCDTCDGRGFFMVNAHGPQEVKCPDCKGVGVRDPVTLTPWAIGESLSTFLRRWLIAGKTEEQFLLAYPYVTRLDLDKAK